MTKQEALSYIDDFTWSTAKIGLHRTRALLSKVGDPQKKLKFIHVAGSNGKGSTCAMLESILRRAGYRTGLYISPYIQDFSERIQVCGQKIDDESLISLTEQVKALADAMEDHPTQFEIITVIGMLYFAAQHCDIVVLETGMGGEFDSTNVIDAPVLAILTNIGLEHTQYLGSTIEEIAKTKSGIIKKGCHCICYEGDPVAIFTIKEKCAALSVPFHLASFQEITPLGQDLHGQDFLYQNIRYHLSLLGIYQLHNVSVVLSAVRVLQSLNWHITEDNIQQALATVTWPARMEIVTNSPLFILDGGHNDQCADALCETLHAILPRKKCIFIFGVLKDKDYLAMIRRTLPYAQEYICLEPLSPRALNPVALKEAIEYEGGTATAFKDIPEAISYACQQAKETVPIVSFGSLYLAGQIRTYVQKMKAEK